MTKDIDTGAVVERARRDVAAGVLPTMLAILGFVAGGLGVWALREVQSLRVDHETLRVRVDHVSKMEGVNARLDNLVDSMKRVETDVADVKRQLGTRPAR